MAEDKLKSLIDGLMPSIKSAEEMSKASERLVEYLRDNPQDASRVSWDAPLKALRAARAFPQMARLAECLIGFGCEQGIVRRQYGQALIERGMPSAAISVLQPLADSNDSENLEAKGLIGRAHKDLYVEGKLGKTPIGKSTLQKALDAYGAAYAAKKQAWHGVNVAALLHRAKSDGLEMSYDRTSQQVASELLDSIAEKTKSGKPMEAWDWATAAEAHVAQENWEEADRAIKNYVASPDRDAFQLWGTLRQLRKVWNIGAYEERGKEIVNVLQGELARYGNGEFTFTPKQLVEAANVKRETYERILGHEGPRRTHGLSRCSNADDRLGRCAANSNRMALALASW
jgi:hypothetical protein